MISASALFQHAADLASSALDWHDTYPYRELDPMLALYTSPPDHLEYALSLLEWAGKEDFPTEIVTVAIGQLVRLENGGSAGENWRKLVLDTVDTCRDAAVDLGEIG